MYTFLRNRALRKPFAILLFCSSLFLVIFFIPSCKKGDPGTANVIFSEWFKPNAWKKDTVYGIWGFNYDLAAPQITKKLLDSGTVIVYGKLRGYNVKIWDTSRVQQLPISLTYISGQTMTDTWSGVATPGNLRIRFVNDKNYWTSIATEHLFRYIIIPGAVKTTNTTGSGRNIITRTGNMLDLDKVERMPYEELCAKLGIHE